MDHRRFYFWSTQLVSDVRAKTFSIRFKMPIYSGLNLNYITNQGFASSFHADFHKQSVQWSVLKSYSMLQMFHSQSPCYPIYYVAVSTMVQSPLENQTLDRRLTRSYYSRRRMCRQNTSSRSGVPRDLSKRYSLQLSRKRDFAERSKRKETNITFHRSPSAERH